MENRPSSVDNRFKMGNYARVENDKRTAAYQSAKRRKNYRPTSTVTRTAWVSPKPKTQNMDLEEIAETPIKKELLPEVLSVREPEPETPVNETAVKENPKVEEEVAKVLEEHKEYEKVRDNEEM
jgi:hypothetical protein